MSESVTERDARDEEGSILLLTLGYALLAIALVFVSVSATSLYLMQKRVDAVADAAALAGADGFVIDVNGGVPVARLTDEGVAEQARLLLGGADDMRIVRAVTPDGSSARVTVEAVWRPPVVSLFVPDGVVLTSTATSRTALG
ncbi:pilus assembly protein TadG-related protein [Microbacterium sp.]|uniref:pilus assembly protein TadG-related protein n=1 Tax=Microbacterium sp. TaxID=51671 RepID=UPI0039E308F8